MDGPEAGTDAAGTVERSRPEHRVIGFVGKGAITEYEEAALTYIGKCIAALGHTLIIVPAKGAATALRVGVETQGGKVQLVEAGVLDRADRTLLYPDPNLLDRLKRAYPDLDNMKNVVNLAEHDLDMWIDALKAILDEYQISRP